MGLEKNIKDGQIVVFSVPQSNYEDGLEEVVSSVFAVSKSICFVAMNKPYATLGTMFKAKGLDLGKVTFIDCVTGRVSKDKTYNVVSVSSPKALTELSITMSQTMKKDFDFIIFDSLSTLLVYGDSITAIKFVHSIVSKIRETKKKMIFMVLKEDSATDLMKDISMFVDKIIPVGK